MKCDDVLPLIRCHADRELEPADAERIEAHVSGCASCAERLEAERELKLVIRTKGRVGPAPAGVASAIKRSVRAEAGLPTAVPRWRTMHRRRLVAGILAAGLLIAALAVMWLPWPSQPEQDGHRQTASRLTVELVDDHIRYLGVEAPAQLATADRADAERWFNAQLDIAVELPRFEEGTAGLRGGRLCYVLDRRVALLFYTRGAERLSLFVMNAGGLDFQGMAPVDLAHGECATESYKGYEILGWKRRGLLFALVADDREDGLEALVAGAYQE